MKLSFCLYNACCAVTVLIAMSLIVLEIFFLEQIVREQA